MPVPRLKQESVVDLAVQEANRLHVKIGGLEAVFFTPKEKTLEAYKLAGLKCQPEDKWTVRFIDPVAVESLKKGIHLEPGEFIFTVNDKDGKVEYCSHRI